MRAVSVRRATFRAIAQLGGPRAAHSVGGITASVGTARAAGLSLAALLAGPALFGAGIADDTHAATVLPLLVVATGNAAVALLHELVVAYAGAQRPRMLMGATALIGVVEARGDPDEQKRAQGAQRQRPTDALSRQGVSRSLLAAERRAPGRALNRPSRSRTMAGLGRVMEGGPCEKWNRRRHPRRGLPIRGLHCRNSRVGAGQHWPTRETGRRAFGASESACGGARERGPPAAGDVSRLRRIDVHRPRRIDVDDLRPE